MDGSRSRRMDKVTQAEFGGVHTRGLTTELGALTVTGQKGQQELSKDQRMTPGRTRQRRWTDRKGGGTGSPLSKELLSQMGTKRWKQIRKKRQRLRFCRYTPSSAGWPFLLVPLLLSFVRCPIPASGSRGP